jgi:hypothetical protein
VGAQSRRNCAASAHREVEREHVAAPRSRSDARAASHFARLVAASLSLSRLRYPAPTGGHQAGSGSFACGMGDRQSAHGLRRRPEGASKNTASNNYSENDPDDGRQITAQEGHVLTVGADAPRPRARMTDTPVAAEREQRAKNRDTHDFSSRRRGCRSLVTNDGASDPPWTTRDAYWSRSRAADETRVAKSSLWPPSAFDRVAHVLLTPFIAPLRADQLECLRAPALPL